MNRSVNALTVFDDGAGPALYAGGHFTTAGGVEVNHIAKWDGEAWSALGGGMSGSDPRFPWTVVNALTVFDGGAGPALYAGGHFTTVNGVEVNHIAKWDGEAWSALGDGVTGSVDALAVFDDGAGPALYASGHFTTAGEVEVNHIAKWDGEAWSALGGGVEHTGTGPFPPRVRVLTVFDDGAGSALYAGGDFTTAGGIEANRIAKWDGAAWSALSGETGGSVLALTVFDDDWGPALYAGGGFALIGRVLVNRVARWDGAAWSPLWGRGGRGVNGQVLSLTVFDGGARPALYVGGRFTTAGGIEANNIAKWDGKAWSALGGGMDRSVSALAVFDDGAGPALYAGSYFDTPGSVGAIYVAKCGCATEPLPIDHNASGAQ